ncbi:MAG TPA: DNA mismatch repair endonuclease MutL [Flavobacteriales bacterium]|nr:DNA mismatch repair endonuclease MutL [Flavobacteriales bacterium]HRE74412.1 DNA mismatch repair endonuclease MutL [Flavobacteriales bacterium]HRJ35194.1 DNA mismatch repair endonuclease MutL [Flavobacteriales bacterium]HRJ40039.1 DNA mismatch repair endonuclease MutL [Flavobacteriales bacterium]
MSNIIRLLPDSVANQIAAGEVVQRPASAVKELMENAVDAGASKIRLVVKDAGRTLLQVIDNGCGMTADDAQLSFVRHATSKIGNAEDLFRIQTKGFRGEALASIAAVAQVEMKTKRREDELGTRIVIEGSEIQEVHADPCQDGTQFLVKNLFFNIPARRNFLKSDNVEFKHILEEFERVALPHPSIQFELNHNGNEVFNLPSQNLRQRIVALFGKTYNERLVPIEENTEIVAIKGFLLKPEFTRKTRGEQYFFVNDRFIRSPYLHHALQKAYEGLIPKENFPGYFVFLSVPTNSIDVNIHPTKTEIKFEDERSIYAILHSAARRAIGFHNISPSIDFNTETAIDLPLPDKDRIPQAPVIRVDPNYNPFDSEKKNTAYPTEYKHQKKQAAQNWESIYETLKEEPRKQEQLFEEGSDVNQKRVTVQLQGKYILCPVKSGFWLIDQHRAHSRILFERFIVSLAQHTGMSQQMLFPTMVELTPGDFALVRDLDEDLRHLGFELSDMGGNSIAVNGVPAEAGDIHPGTLIEKMLEDLKHSGNAAGKEKSERIARSLAESLAIKTGKTLMTEEMNRLVDELFACESPYVSPSGKPVIVTFTAEELEKRFA